MMIYPLTLKLMSLIKPLWVALELQRLFFVGAQHWWICDCTISLMSKQLPRKFSFRVNTS